MSVGWSGIGEGTASFAYLRHDAAPSINSGVNRTVGRQAKQTTAPSCIGAANRLDRSRRRWNSLPM
jgi:hypothetical protein